jgi:formylglycine-generating enzyme required for sulfatase activity
MSANVWEWTVSSSNGIVRGCRGGSWSIKMDTPEILKASFRREFQPWTHDDVHGFRCVKSIVTPVP